MKKINPNLTKEQKIVLFEEGTENPGSSQLNQEKREGTYHCVNCDIKLFDSNNKLTNLFLLVSNLPDLKGYIKTGNQRVIEARLSDAKFFWDKNKNQNLVKQVSKLKNLLYFKKNGKNL